VIHLSEELADNMAGWEPIKEIFGGTAKFRVMAWCSQHGVDEDVRYGDMMNDLRRSVSLWGDTMKRMERLRMVSGRRNTGPPGGTIWTKRESPWWAVIEAACVAAGIDTVPLRPTEDEVAEAARGLRRLEHELAADERP
jgi:hypothetical protein